MSQNEYNRKCALYQQLTLRAQRKNLTVTERRRLTDTAEAILRDIRRAHLIEAA